MQNDLRDKLAGYLRKLAEQAAIGNALRTVQKAFEETTADLDDTLKLLNGYVSRTVPSLVKFEDGTSVVVRWRERCDHPYVERYDAEGTRLI